MSFSLRLLDPTQSNPIASGLDTKYISHLSGHSHDVVDQSGGIYQLRVRSRCRGSYWKNKKYSEKIALTHLCP